jgi:hypothetical protein
MLSKNTVYQWRRVYARENKSNLCPTLTANMGSGGHNVPLIKDDFGIRKLTPKECFDRFLVDYPMFNVLRAEVCQRISTPDGPKEYRWVDIERYRGS